MPVRAARPEDLRHSFPSRGSNNLSGRETTARRGPPRWTDPAIFALIVEAKDEDVAGFCRRLGFQSFASRPMSLFLPVSTFAKAGLQ